MKSNPGRNRADKFPVRFFLFFLAWFLAGFMPATGIKATESLKTPHEDEIKGTFSPLGYEGGGRFTSIAVNPKNPGIILIGSDVCGVFKSVDGGQSFTPKCEGLQEFAVAAMAYSPVDSDHVILLTDNGLYLSLDNAEHWEKKTSAVRYNSRRFGNQLIVFSGDMLWVATDRDGIFRMKATDGPWKPEEVQGLAGKLISSVALHQDEVYVGTSQGVYRHSGGKWVPFCDGLDPGFVRIENIIEHSSGRMYLVEYSKGLYTWDEDKKKWDYRGIGYLRQLIDRPQGFKAIAVNPANPEIILLATCPETWPYILYKSTDEGRSWRVVENFKMCPNAPESFAKGIADVEEIMFLPQSPSNIFMTDWVNVWRSADYGDNWTQVHKGLQNTVVNDIKLHPSDSSKLFMALSDNGLVVSTDGGRTWKRKTTGLPDGDALEIGFAPTNLKKMYLLMRPWKRKDKIFVFRSEDGGEHWIDVSFSVPTEPLKKENFIDGQATNIVIDPAMDDVVYVATNGYGVFRSDNGGIDWKAVNRGLDTPYIKGPGALVADPSKAGVLYAATLLGGVFRSEDRGQNWSSISGKYFAYSLALVPGNPTKIYAACDDGKVIMSEDSGRAWQEISLPGSSSTNVAAYSLAVNLSDPRWILVGTMRFDFKASEGVFLSGDAGRTFLRCRSGIPSVGVNRVIFVPGGKGEQRFLIGLNGAGPYQGKIVEAK